MVPLPVVAQLVVPMPVATQPVVLLPIPDQPGEPPTTPGPLDLISSV